MPTVEELISKFRNYSDEELFNVHEQLDGYTDSGKQAFQVVASERGGINTLKEKISRQKEIENEILRIKSHTLSLLNKGIDPEEIKERLEIRHITREQFDQVVQEAINETLHEKFDKKIKPRTVIGSLFGGLIGGTIGGIGWGIQMVMSKHIFWIFAFGLVVLSYGIIRLFTGQSKKNVIVFLFTALSVIYALVLGQIIFEIFGN